MMSVTQVLDAYTEPAIWKWKLRVGEKKARAISEEALAIGKEVDRLIQEDIGGVPSLAPVSGEVEVAMAGWSLFREAHPEYVGGITQIQAELTQGQIVGHPDIVHLREVSDIKTSKGLKIRAKWVVQASKYAVMAGKTRAGIILLSKTDPGYLYVWWEGTVLEYFGKTVFDAFGVIMEYETVVEDMVREFLEDIVV